MSCRHYWLPISPFPFASRLRTFGPERKIRFISARHDLTFLPELSRHMIGEVRRLKGAPGCGVASVRPLHARRVALEIHRGLESGEFLQAASVELITQK
ncbi:MAG: hypothetical protein WKF84_29070 [Pyrinomonadaceae bacterium]